MIGSRSRLAALVAAVALSAVTVPAGAASGPALVIEGSSSASMTVTLRQSLTLDLNGARFEGGREFVGWWLREESRLETGSTNGAGGVVLDGMPEFGTFPREFFQIRLGATRDRITLPPGNYVAYLFTDGPARITVPVVEGAATMLTPSTPVAAAGAAGDLPVVAGTASGPGASARWATQPVRRSARTVTVSMFAVGDQTTSVADGALNVGAHATSYAACVTLTPYGPCPDDGILGGSGRSGSYGYAVDPDYGYRSLQVSWAMYDAGVSPSGDVFARQDDFAVSNDHYAAGGYFTADL